MKITEDDIPFLESATAHKLRAHYAQQIKVTVDALIHAAMESSDPKVRGLATSFATWKAAHKELTNNAE